MTPLLLVYCFCLTIFNIPYRHIIDPRIDRYAKPHPPVELSRHSSPHPTITQRTSSS
ncbi:hypothetical protein DL95DRAFT_384845, partial [Leptodontidium sp. 2 PMI_412]